MKPRVVITGIGLLTPVGRGVDEVWSNLVAGRSGIGAITLFDARSLPVRIGGEVKTFDVARVRREFPGVAADHDRKVWLGLDAAAQAIDDSGLPEAAFSRAPLFVGVSLETFHLEDVAPVAHAADLAAALAVHLRQQHPRLQLQTSLDRVAGQLSARYGLRGGRHVNCSACAAGAQAIGEAFRRLRDDGAEIALAGATDSILNPLGLGGFSLLQILSAENDRPTKACRPFDATRQGTVLAEGAAFLVLETEPHARQRGARIYAEIAGYASSLDAFRVSDPEPSGRGAARSMTRAIADAGLAPEELDAINAHGTGTPKNDVAETLAIKQVFGPRAYRIPITANKSMTGHMIAASGAVEAAASALMLRTGRIPPTINRDAPDPQCDLDYTTGPACDFAGDTVLSNSFGFGGQNATLLFRRHTL